MPKPPRSQRKGRPKPAPRPEVPTPSPAGGGPVSSLAAAAPPITTPEPVRERSIGRFTARDYSHVQREVLRIVILALAMLVIIVVLSFFLP